MAGVIKNLEVAIDLGSDTVKVSYAYDNSGSVEYGKLAPISAAGSIIVPAIAYYDEEDGNGTWIYGEDVYKSVDKSFVSVVKIKSLLSMLLIRANKDITKRNIDYYFNQKQFPKFYFPSRKKQAEDFDEAVKLDMTFEADRTPQKVCEGFFEYLVKKTILPAIERLQKAIGKNFSKINYSIVYPTKVGPEYVDELKRIAKKACGSDMKKVLSTTRALGLFAYHRGELKTNDEVLIFDMGEEDISVAKFILDKKGNLLIDGVDGHNAPMELGGNDVDYAVKDCVERIISGRETVGAPSVGENGYIAEHGTHSAQFLFLNEIKRAKMNLSLDDAVYERAFEEDGDDMGVPLSIQRDVAIETNVKREQFKNCIGINDDSGIAKKILDYITQELKRSNNKKVKKIMLSGGVTETFGLLEYIEDALSVKVITFDDYETEDNTFTILSNEDSTYAPATGGAIVALKDYELKAIVALSYGTWGMFNKNKVLQIFLDKGAEIPPTGKDFYTAMPIGKESSWVDIVRDDELYSTPYGKEELGNDPKDPYVIGDINSTKRKEAEEEIGLKVVAGGKGSEIRFFYGGRQVEIRGMIDLQEGVHLDADGRAVPFIRNDKAKNKGSMVIIRPLGSTATSRESTVESDKIVLEFTGIGGFVVEGKD